MTLWDITQPLRPGLPVWPGDTAFRAARTWSYGPDCPVNVSAFTASTHSGTHADAPLHYDPDGTSIEAVPLEPYIGPARIIDGRGWGRVIGAEHLLPHLQAVPPRVLIRTYETFPHDQWDSDFASLSAEAITLLARHGVRLIGVDTPSLDPQDSKTMDAHLAVKAAGMRILEGLVLDDVPAGDYELIALPLALSGLDAAPVRAVLRDLIR
jgi:arylformamidase